MSSYVCPCCGNDSPLSEPCPRCETFVQKALRGEYDITPEYMPLPHNEVQALLARLDATRLHLAVQTELINQKNREIQRLHDNEAMILRNGMTVINQLADAKAELQRLRAPMASDISRSPATTEPPGPPPDPNAWLDFPNDEAIRFHRHWWRLNGRTGKPQPVELKFIGHDLVDDTGDSPPLVLRSPGREDAASFRWYLADKWQPRGLINGGGQ